MIKSIPMNIYTITMHEAWQKAYDELKTDYDKLEQINAVYKEALEWYATIIDGDNPLDYDGTARDALESAKRLKENK